MCKNPGGCQVFNRTSKDYNKVCLQLVEITPDCPCHKRNIKELVAAAKQLLVQIFSPSSGRWRAAWLDAHCAKTALLAECHIIQLTEKN